MKKLLSIVFIFALMLSLVGCTEEDVNPDKWAPTKDEIDLHDPDLNPEKPMYSGCLYTYGTSVAGKNFSSGSLEWKGYHKLGNEIGKVPTRIVFSPSGNIKMYTKPMDDEDWQEVKDFNVDRMRVQTDKEDVDDIIEFPKATDYCIMEDSKENADKDFPCITLYPEGVPIQENSPFNIVLCIDGQGSMTLDMLKHTFYLSS